MVKNISNFIAGSICFLFFTNSLAQQSGTLTVNAENFNNDTGKAVVSLFRKEDDIPKKHFLQTSATIKNGKATLTFENLPYGDYALILFHDENDNSTLDHKLGFPNEPMCFSNNWKLSLFSGMPNFEKLRFEFGINTPGIMVKLK
jgi:uncharacterized protein (DUF2141 family)